MLISYIYIFNSYYLSKFLSASQLVEIFDKHLYALDFNYNSIFITFTCT